MSERIAIRHHDGKYYTVIYPDTLDELRTEDYWPIGQGATPGVYIHPSPWESPDEARLRDPLFLGRVQEGVNGKAK